MTDVIAFQGLPGAYSDLACRAAYPGWTTLPCPSFEAAMDAVRGGAAGLADAIVAAKLAAPSTRAAASAGGRLGTA